MAESPRAAGRAGWAEGLRTRTIYGALMAAIAAACILLGDVAFAVLVACCAVAMASEWTRLSSSGRFGPSGWLAVLVPVACIALTHLDRTTLALALALAGSLAALLLARATSRPVPAWAAAGVLYVALPVVALVWLRGHDASGERMFVWLVLAVAASDTGAFFAGRLVGGPLLAPRISPKKTWAGLGGAVASSVAVGFAVAALDGKAPPAAALAVAGAVLAVVAQAGDLAESAFKRHFGAKDASALIPGHGGMMDRVDGLVAAAACLAAFQWASAGGLLAWR
ncbi:MAG: phosphatidate cytidylyltransferase [Alphaproteobacteria bacterium]